MKRLLLLMYASFLSLSLLAQKALYKPIGSKIRIEYMHNGKSGYKAEGTIVGREKLQEGNMLVEYVDIQYRNDQYLPYGRPIGNNLLDLEFYGVTDKPGVFVHLCVDQIYLMGEYMITIPLLPWNTELLKDVLIIRVDRKSAQESKQAIFLNKQRRDAYLESHPSLF